MRRLQTLLLPATLTALLAANIAQAQSVNTIDPALRDRIDRIAAQVLQQTGVPSASVAVVQHGKLVYTHAYGLARLQTARIPATPEMRYSIGSISKQFTADRDPAPPGARQALASTIPSASTSPASPAATKSPSAKSSPTPPAIRTTGPRTTS